MLAATFQGVERISVVEKHEPQILGPKDAVVEIELAGLCGSDLHPYFGRERGIDPGTIMGHEFTGCITVVGEQVSNFRVGDRVASPFSTSCGCCRPCQRGLSARCREGRLFGWVEGGVGLEGAQAGQVRVPLADGTLVHRSKGLSAFEALLLGDVVSTGFFAVERSAPRSGCPVAVIGLGAVGLSAVLAAVHAGAKPVIACDLVPERLEVALEFGAVPLSVGDSKGLPSSPTALGEATRRICGGEGVETVVEAVGSPESLRLAVELLRPGGYLSMVGVHTEDHYALSPVLAYDKNLTLATGRCPVRSHMEKLCLLQEEARLPIERLITHRLPLSEATDAYRLFAAREAGCIKVVFEP